MAVVVEGGVGIDNGVGAFSDDVIDAAGVEVGQELGALGLLDAVVWPKGLGQAVELDGGKGAVAGVLTGEGKMVGRVPILCGDDQAKARQKLVDDGDDGVAVGYGQGAFRLIVGGGGEVVLQVDEDKSVHWSIPVGRCDFAAGLPPVVFVMVNVSGFEHQIGFSLIEGFFQADVIAVGFDGGGWDLRGRRGSDFHGESGGAHFSGLAGWGA